MIRLTGAEVAALADGRTDAAAAAVVVAGPVVVDSRAAGPGSLFVAVAGERLDGHDYGGDAAAAGAVLALGVRPVAGLPTVVVADPVTALGRLAHGVLRRLPQAEVVGLTGSVGKTTTKDLLADLLGRIGPTVAPPGSYNNEVGLPLTVLLADERTRHLVLEMGARGRGHVRALTELAPPRVGVVLNVGSAHVGEFGSVDAVADAKGELVAALPAGGLAVLNADDPRVLAMSGRTAARVLTFGRSASADVRAVDVAVDRGSARFRLQASDGAGSAPVRLRLLGEHQVVNALAAATVALAHGLGVADVADALSSATASSHWRMELVERPDGVTVLNDAYNANPESVAAALHALASVADGRRSWAVLGEMLELGDASAAAHEEVGRLAARLRLGRLVVVGEGAEAVLAGAVAEGTWDQPPVAVGDVDAATDLLRDELAPGDVVLVKASRGAGLDRVASRLLAEVPG